MAHYFTDNTDLKSELFTYEATILGVKYTLYSDNGVFSKEHLDFGSLLLIEEFKNPDIEGKLLDLGCGNGVIGIALGKSYKRDVFMVDINPRATLLASKNATRNKVNHQVLTTDCLNGVEEEFACVLTNPPIRAGKKVVYNFFLESFNHLKTNGELWFVMRRNHGVESAIKYIDELFNNHEVVKRKNGFWIVKAIKLK